MTNKQIEENRKKINTWILILVFIYPIAILLTFSWITRDYKWKFSNDIDQIKAIYIVDATSESEYEIIKEIPVLKRNELLKDVYDVANYQRKFVFKIQHTDGICFLIEYDDNSYDLIASSYPCKCVVNDDESFSYYVKYYKMSNKKEFERLIVKYLED